MKRLFTLVAVMFAIAFVTDVKANNFEFPSERSTVCAPTETSSAILSGRVRDFSNGEQPLDGVYIYLIDQDTNTVCQQVFTSSLGYFAFEPTFASGQGYVLQIPPSKKCRNGWFAIIAVTQSGFGDYVVNCGPQ